MSSNEDEYNDGDSLSGLLQKKRRIQRACDICRRKKSDGVQMPGNNCSNCISCGLGCTYVEAAKKRGPPKGYVESLENKVEKLEKLLRRLCPDDAVYNQLNASLDSNWTIERPPVDPSALVDKISSNGQPNAPTLEKVTSAIRGAMEDKSGTTRSDTRDEDDPSLILADNLKQLALTPNDLRFFGKSSGAMLVRTAMELRNEYTGDEGRFDHPVKPAVKDKRTEFWDMKPWERKSEATAFPKYSFPDLELALHCIDLYFHCTNLYMPLLHRPTFDKSVKEGLYLVNDNFAPVFLVVCAIGARYSDNPQVRLEGVESHHSAGWKWFEQVQIMKRSLLAPPTLYDLQLYCLRVQYLQGSSAPQSCWTLAGIGIRLAQDVGAHRRKLHTHKPTPDDELWKRAFWVLVCMDRVLSSSLGRPCAIQDEDFDLDLPVDCDDEYWDHLDPDQPFKQPPNKPSSISSFILTVKLQQILAFALRTIYSINKSKILLGFVGEQWEQHIVAELDSALNKWVDAVPDHLRWDPNREDDTFFNQSVYLYATYYHIQIIIHRPFIPSPSKPSPLSFPSLAICTNAARSCSHVVDIHRRRSGISLPLTQMPVFTSGVVLLLSIWGGKRSGLSMDPHKEMIDVHKCMKVLKASEARWHSAGRLWDVLYELARVGELPLPQPSPPSMKRDREWDSPPSSHASEQTSGPMSQTEASSRIIAGSRRVRKQPSSINQAQQLQTHPTHPPPHQQSQAAPPPPPLHQSHNPRPPPERVRSRRYSHSQTRANESQQTASEVPSFNNTDLNVFALPVYSNDLARLPLHGQMTFSAQAHEPQTYPPPETNYWYASEPMSHADAGGPTSSYGSHYPPASVPQQQPYSHHHAPQGIPGGEYPLASEASSMSQGPYRTDAAELATGMLFDTMLGRGGYTQQRTATYGSGPMHSSFSSMGSGSMVSTPPLSSGSSMEDMYPGMGMETMPDRSGGHYQQQHQHQGVPPQQEQQMSYPFVLDHDAGAIWSNAPTGFQMDQWGTYLANIGELMQQDHDHLHPSN
ncbi:hypothetical protein M413DRAFT_412939 [Hebeloma cylindrosporum]|uniref:Transcription factor domain-containing protein n=1 Tax=Hebeloma cylindrosporum TaxID=76867 RepID=A0A0C3CB06_HEBCY|nr:hypothetical protein M413DRAFT_412939 [Hebeloma cylindrosporum h7]